MELKYHRIVTKLLDGRSNVRIPIGVGDLFPSKTSRPTSGPT